jgi:hypothetical protein
MLHYPYLIMVAFLLMVHETSRGRMDDYAGRRNDQRHRASAKKNR